MPNRAPTLYNDVLRHLHDLLTSQAIQPGAAELLEQLEEKFGWLARHVMAEAVAALRDDKSLPAYQRDYLRTTLSDASLSEALRGGVKKNYEDTATLDKLFQRSAAYRNSAAFREMIEFTAKFREYAPYNNMLVKLQNPACGFYATERDWRGRFGRHLIEDARPMLILAPMRPVMLVYDLDQTEGQPLPQKLADFMLTEGCLDPDRLLTLIENAKRDRIRVDMVPLNTALSGLATTRIRGSDWKMRVKVHEGLTTAAQFSVLCHELAHIHLGHLGGDPDGAWPSRSNLSHSTVEIEAEAVAYIVAIRLGLCPASESYLSNFLPSAAVPKTVSMELISKVAGKLITMTERLQPPKKQRGSPKTTD